MRTRSFSVAFVLALSTAACAEPAPDARSAVPAPAILPLRSLRLYETGVGYFERSGGLAGKGTTTLPVPAGHLDDALASLVVLRADGTGQVAGLSFASSVTKATARSSVGLPPDPTSPIGFQNLLESMKGARVTITTRDMSGPLEGRVVEVAMETDEARARALAEIKDAKQDAPKRLVLTLLTTRGEITTVPAESIVRIRPTDPAFAARLDAALDALGTRAAENARALKLLGDAHGDVSFGYIAETPIWRASYRLIDGKKTGDAGTSAVLQGWALIHNDTDESWHDVHLELVNGEPDSFVFPMAAPRYTRRELVHPDAPLSTLPQLQDTTADALWGDNVSGDGLTLDGIGTIGHGYGTGGGRGEGGGGMGRYAMASVDGKTSSSSLLAVGNLAELATTSGAEQGAFFVYAVPNGLSLEAHASGLVPFIQRSVVIERLAYFAKPDGGGRAAVRFINGTGQTLPAGTLSFYGDGGFLGETTLDRLKPGERRFLQVGNDLDAEVRETKRTSREESKRLTFEGDALREHFLRTTALTWELENRSGTARVFDVVLAADSNAKVTGADRVDFDEAGNSPIVVFDVAAKQKPTRTLTVVEGLSRSLRVDGLTEKAVRAILAKATIPPTDLAVLQRALPRVVALEASRTAVTTADRATAVAQQDLERLREDLKALGGAASGGSVAAPLVKRVVDAEDQVGVARRNKELATSTLNDRKEQLREALRPLALPTPG